jgi:hypothetical protein
LKEKARESHVERGRRKSNSVFIDPSSAEVAWELLEFSLSRLDRDTQQRDHTPIPSLFCPSILMFMFLEEYIVRLDWNFISPSLLSLFIIIHVHTYVYVIGHGMTELKQTEAEV